MVVAEINELGDTIKTKKITAFTGSIGGGLIEDAGTDLWLHGSRIGVTAYTQSFLTKTDSNYDPIFSKFYSSPTGHLSLSPSSLIDTTFLEQGFITQGAWNNPINMALIKIDKNGDTLWCKKYGDGGNLLVPSFTSIIPFPNGSFIMSGGTRAIDTGDVVLSKIDINGNVMWAKAYGGSANEGSAIHYINNNSIFSFGISNSFSGSQYNGLLIKTDTLGNLIWAKSISCPSGYNYQFGQYENNKRLLTITGMSSYSTTNWEFLTMQIDTNGNVVNNKVYSFSPDNDYGLSFVKMNDGGYLFSLSEYNNSILAYDTKIFKTDSLFNSGCLPSTTISFTTTDVTALMHVNTLTMVVSPLYIDVIDTVTFGSGRGCAIQTECNGFVGVEEQENKESNIKFYPNPANDVVYFDYQLPENISQATVNVYNYAGMLVQSFVIYGNEGTATQNVSELSNGLYMFSIISNKNTIAQQKIVINK